MESPAASLPDPGGPFLAETAGDRQAFLSNINPDPSFIMSF
jgi:hypothetical protein